MCLSAFSILKYSSNNAVACAESGQIAGRIGTSSLRTISGHAEFWAARADRAMNNCVGLGSRSRWKELF